MAGRKRDNETANWLVAGHTAGIDYPTLSAGSESLTAVKE